MPIKNTFSYMDYDEWEKEMGISEPQEAAQETNNTEEEIKAPPSFPVLAQEGFYGILSQFTDLATEHSEASREAVLMSTLTALATFFGNVSIFQLGDSWIEPRLFTALAGTSARARKGTSFKSVARLIDSIQQELNLMVSYKIPTQYKNGVFPSEQLPQMGGLSSAEGLIYQVRDEFKILKKDQEIIEDEGVEDKRLLIVEEELGKVLKMAQREGNTLSQTLREAFDGSILSPMTKNNIIQSTYPHINLLGHITRYELIQLMNESDVHNGLYNRFLWCCVRRSKLVPIPKAMDSKKLKGIAKKIAQSIRYAHRKNRLGFSQEAAEFWTDIYNRIAKQPRSNQRVESLTSRHETHILRIAMILALLDQTNLVEPVHLNVSAAILDYCNESVNYLFTGIDPEDDTDAQLIISTLKEHGGLTRTQISKVFSNNRTRVQLNQLLTALEGGGHITAEKMKRKGGKGAVFYRLSDIHK